MRIHSRLSWGLVAGFLLIARSPIWSQVTSLSIDTPSMMCIIQTTCTSIDEVHQAVALVRQAGGLVTTVVSDNYFVGVIPRESEQLIERSGLIKSVTHKEEELAEIESSMIQEHALSRLFSEHMRPGRDAGTHPGFAPVGSEDLVTGKESESSAPPKWETAALHRSANVRYEQYQQLYTCERMTGSVATALFFLESDSLHNPHGVYWSTAAKEGRISDAILAYTILSENAKIYGIDLTFFMEVYEASNHPATVVPVDLLPYGQSKVDPLIFLNYVFTALGYSKIESNVDMLSRIEEFNEDLRKSLKTDWAVSNFFYRKQNSGFGVAWYNFTMMTYWDNFWTTFPNALAHETSHCFGAFDEYSIDFPTCDWERNGVKNLNKFANPCSYHLECLMGYHFGKICVYTAAHVGWTRETPQPTLVFPDDDSVVEQGNVRFGWSRNTDNSTIYCKLTILDDHTGRMVYRESTNSRDTTSNRAVILTPGKYRWFVANGGGVEEASWAHAKSAERTLVVEEVTRIDEPAHVPRRHVLFQNYPNPYNASTVITYQVALSSLVVIRVYDSLGRMVATLVNEEKQPGIYEVSFTTPGLRSGMYICQMETNEFTKTIKLVLK